MTILALEFSSPQRSAAVARDKMILAEAVESGGGRNTNAFGMIEQVLAEAKMEREEIAVVAVGLGPGSYTGIRAAISIAQGWQLARGIKLLGIVSTEAIAARAQIEKIFGRVNVVIDAQRNEFYLAGYEISVGKISKAGPLQILSAGEIQSRAAKEIFIGPDIHRHFPGGRTIFPTAAILAELAVAKNNFVSADKLEPVYLRETNFVKAPPRNPIAL